MIGSPELFAISSDFIVHDKFPESDHVPLPIVINCRLKCDIPRKGRTHKPMWTRHHRCRWSPLNVRELKNILNDEISMPFREQIFKSFINMKSSNDLAICLTNYITQAADRLFERNTSKPLTSKRGPGWYDNECRQLRSEAIKAGERVITDCDHRMLIEKSRAYKACKQRKSREYRRYAVNKIDEAYVNNRGDIWKIISQYTFAGKSHNEPNAEQFYEYFSDLARGFTVEYFNYDYEKCAIDFLNKYDNDEFSMHNNDGLKLQIINDNFTEKEISDTIDSLKNNKSPGNDLLPAEFIKACKAELLPLITEALNYIINHREFPDIWAEGLRCPVFKTGDINNRNNYRGITVLSVITKFFETAVNNRLNFVATAYDSGDRFNGGFTKGSMTSDNIFILQGLIERQMTLGKPLYLCMVDFSKAFDLVDTNILFFKLIKSGIHGKVVDALRSLYRKTYFRPKHHGLLSPPTRDTHGVNQGGNTSPTLFRHYLSDLGDFLHQKCVLCISSDIIAHLLWADDLVLVSDS